jgi:glutathione synthase
MIDIIKVFTVWINSAFKYRPSQIMILSAFDVILMRKAPPFDMNYIYATYFLEQAEKQGVLGINSAFKYRAF